MSDKELNAEIKKLFEKETDKLITDLNKNIKFTDLIIGALGLLLSNYVLNLMI